MKIKFDSDDNLLLNKAVEIPILPIVVRAIVHKSNLSACLSTSFNVYVKYKDVIL